MSESPARAAATMGTAYRLHAPLGIILCIPGGWRVPIARIEAEPWLYADIAAYLVRTGMPADKAITSARRAVQQSFVHGYTNGLRECVWRRACEYADMWPEHRMATGDLRIAKGRKGEWPVVMLRGFDPAAIVSVYVPMQNMGSRGRDYVRSVLADMGRVAAL